MPLDVNQPYFLRLSLGDDSRLIGGVLFSGPREGGTLFQRIVKIVTHSWMSHAAIVAPPEQQEPSVYEASLAIVKVSLNIHYRDPKANTIYEIWVPKNLPLERRLLALDTMYKAESGEGYPYLQLLWFAWDGFLKLFGKRAGRHNPFAAHDICSKYAHDEVYQDGGALQALMIRDLPDGNLVSPRDLYEVVVRSGLFELAEKN